MPVEVRPDATKSVSIRINLWYDANRKNIHISSNDVEGFVTTVNDRAGSKRCHESLYQRLRDVLIDAGKWPEDTDASAIHSSEAEK